MYNDNMIVKRVPKAIRDRTKENMEQYMMGLFDAFDDAVRNYGSRCSARLFAAWYYNDYREYIPSAYCPEYLDFEEFPLRYPTR